MPRSVRRIWAAPGRRQLELARAVPGAAVHHLDAGHGACINAPHLFAPAHASLTPPVRAISAP